MNRMKIDEDCINHNAVRMIKDLLEARYDLIEEDKQNQERGFLIMTLGEIAGIIEMADAMCEMIDDAKTVIEVEDETCQTGLKEL